LSNLLVIMSILSGKAITELESKYAGKGYGEFKQDLAHLVVETLAPLQREHERLMNEGNDRVDKALEHGWWKASEVANAKLGKVKELVGVL
jgi:tryptophanyl-tRNA synthetase